MIINLRGTKVRTKLVETSLGHTMFDTYVSNELPLTNNVYFSEIPP